MASNEIEILDADAPVEKQNEIATGRALNRRHFMAAFGMAGTATGAGLLSGCNAASTPIASTANTINSAAEINALNFILNFKYLEATFYSFVTQGVDLPSSLTHNSGTITGAPATKLTFTAANAGPNGVQINDLLNEIYFDEINHLTALVSLLGSSVVARPAINLAPYGALNATALSPTNAIAIARLLEDIGTTVLAGAVQQLANSTTTFVSQMLGAEGFHAGALRLIAIQNPTIVYQHDNADATEVALADPGTIAPTTWAGPTAAGGFFATTGGVYVSSNTNSGLGFARTSSQVLADLYASALGTPAVSGTASGGFFPNGVAGVTNTV
jgi:hypothetical protein